MIEKHNLFLPLKYLKCLSESGILYNNACYSCLSRIVGGMGVNNMYIILNLIDTKYILKRFARI